MRKETVTNVTLDNEAQARAVNALPKIGSGRCRDHAANGKVTAIAIQQEGEKLIVERTPDQVARDAVLASKYSPCHPEAENGRADAAKALLLVDALKAAKPQVRGDMMRLNISEPTVIRMLNERWKSETYKEIARTGYLQFDDDRAVKAEHHRGTPTRIPGRARREASHARVRGCTGKTGVQIVPVNIYRGMPEDRRRAAARTGHRGHC